MADYGLSLGHLQNNSVLDGYDSVETNIESYYPLLMIKDFNGQEFSVSSEFMINADVPTCVFSDIITNPINPITGKEINNQEKYKHLQYILATKERYLPTNNGEQFVPDMWLSVRDNMLDHTNWILLDKHTTLPSEKYEEIK